MKPVLERGKYDRNAPVLLGPSGTFKDRLELRLDQGKGSRIAYLTASAARVLVYALLLEAEKLDGRQEKSN